MGFKGFNLIQPRFDKEHAVNFPVGRMSTARKHFHLENEIYRALGITEEDIDKAQKVVLTVQEIKHQGDYITVHVNFGYAKLVAPFHRKFFKEFKKIIYNKTKIDAFIRKNELIGFRITQ